MEIRPVHGGRLEGARIEIGVTALRTFGVRIALNGENKRRAWRTLGGEAAFGALGEGTRTGLAIAEAVEILRVRREAVENHLGGFPGMEGRHCGLSAVLARDCADLKETFHRLLGQRTGGYAFAGRATEHHGKFGKIVALMVARFHTVHNGFESGIDKVDVSISKSLAAGAKLFVHLKGIASRRTSDFASPRSASFPRRHSTES